MTDAHEPTPSSEAPIPAVPVHDGEGADESDGDTLDLDSIEHDLNGVQAALDRLAEGSYWTDEVSGAPIPVEVLDADPLARRA